MLCRHKVKVYLEFNAEGNTPTTERTVHNDGWGRGQLLRHRPGSALRNNLSRLVPLIHFILYTIYLFCQKTLVQINFCKTINFYHRQVINMVFSLLWWCHNKWNFLFSKLKYTYELLVWPSPRPGAVTVALILTPRIRAVFYTVAVELLARILQIGHNPFFW